MNGWELLDLFVKDYTGLFNWVVSLGGELRLEDLNKLLSEAPVRKDYRGNQRSFWIANYKNRSDLYRRVAELVMMIRFLGWDNNKNLVYSIKKAMEVGYYEYVSDPNGDLEVIGA